MGTSLADATVFFSRTGWLGHDAFVVVIPEQCHSFVILNLFQDNEPPSHVILKQVQDDEPWGGGSWINAYFGDDAIVAGIP